MNIVISCGFFKDGNVSPASFRVRYLTALTMAQKGHNVLFLYSQSLFRYQKLTKSFFTVVNNENLKMIGIPGVLPKILRGYDFIDCFFRFLYIMIYPVEVIHVTGGHRPINLIPSLLGKYLKDSVIVEETWEWMGQGGYADKRKSVLGRIKSLYDRLLEIKLKELYDIIIVISSELQNRFKKKSKVFVLHGGAEDKSLFSYEIEEARKMMNLSRESFIVGMSNVVRSDHQDNREIFEAFRKICKEYQNTYLLITGTNKEYIKRIGREYSIDKRILYSGYLPFEEYNKYLSACNIFVLPYPDSQINRGRWPNKLGDYICLRRPVLTNPTGDLKKLFKKYKVGILCDHNFDSYYRILKEILEKKINLQSYVADSQIVSNDVLGFDQRIDRMLELFESVMKNRRNVINN